MAVRSKREPGPPMLGNPSLKSRGWTDGMIRRFLSEPDATAPNPHYRSGPPRKLYLQSRVEAIESSPEFIAATVASASRKAGAAQAVETKRAALRAAIDAIRVEVPTFDRETLVDLACRHYNQRAERRAWRRMMGGRENEDYEPASPDSNPAFLERISVNMLRHVETEYEDHLRGIFGRVGARDGYHAIREKVLDAIAVTYPWLASECERQMDRARTEAAMTAKE